MLSIERREITITFRTWTFLLKESGYKNARQSKAINQQVYNTEASYNSDGLYVKPKAKNSASVLSDTDSSVKMYNFVKPSENTMQVIKHQPAKTSTAANEDVLQTIDVDCLAIGATHDEEYTSNDIKDYHATSKDDAPTIQSEMEDDAPTKETNDDQDGSKKSLTREGKCQEDFLFTSKRTQSGTLSTILLHEVP